MTTYSFDSVAQVPSEFAWQVQGLLAALEPAVGAGKVLNYHAALTAAESEHVSLGTPLSGAPLVSKDTLPVVAVGAIAEQTLSGQLTAVNSVPEQGLLGWQYDQTMAGMVVRALGTVFPPAAIQDQPWFGWGATASGSTTYYCNLLFVEAADSTPGRSMSVLVLGLTVTVAAGQQQLLTLSPTASAAYTVTAVAIPGYLTQAVQHLT